MEDGRSSEQGNEIRNHGTLGICIGTRNDSIGFRLCDRPSIRYELSDIEIAGRAVVTEQIDLVSLVSSIASLVLAVVAIALAIVFFILATKQAESARSASDSIEGAVGRLELLFNRMYTDTFSIVKKTMDDMSSHIWRREDAAVSPSEESEASNELLEQMAKISTELGITQDQVAALHSRMDPVVRESVNEIASKPSLRHRVIRLLSFRNSRGGEMPTLDEMVKTLSRRENVAVGDVVNILFELREQGRVTWEGDGTRLTGDDEIRLVPRDPTPSA